MFQLVLGPSGHGKTHTIRKFLCDTVKNTGKTAVLLVPDQFTFASERAVLEEATPLLGAKIHVWSFTRLSEEVFLRYGGVQERRLSDTGKFLLMSRAVKSCRDQLKLYGKSSERMTQLMLDAVDEFKACLISPEEVTTAGEQVQGSLREKLSDLGLLYGAYEALLAHTYIDTQDLLTRAVEILRGHKEFFADTVVAVDGFESFNRQKMAMLSLILRDADDCVAALCADSSHAGGGSVLEPVNTTAAALTALAGELGVPVKPPIYLREGVRFQSPELGHLERHLFAPAAPAWPQTADAIQIYEGRTVYDEAEFAAASIRQMVMTGRYRYGDFVILCRDASKYYPVIGSTFEKWGIPCYFSEPKRLDGQPLVRLLLSAYRVIQKGFRTEDLLTMLKSGLCPISSEELSALENYAFLWKISGSGWKQEFTRHPEGFGRQEDESSRETLRALNEIRLRMIGPLSRFAESTRGGTGRELGEAVYNFLTDLGVDRKILENAALYEAAGHPELIGEGAALWQKLMDILDEFAAVLGEQVISREEFFNDLQAVFSKEETKDIPLCQDTVVFGTADQLKPDGVRVAFVLGAVQEELPRIPTSQGVFTDPERLELMDLSFPLEDHLEEQTKLERFIAYTAVTSPSEKLFLCYHIFHGGEDRLPSELVDSLRQMFPTLSVQKECPPEWMISTYDSAFSALASSYQKGDRLTSTLKRLLEEKPEYQGRLGALERAATHGNYRIQSPDTAKKLFGSGNISASQIETYHRCPFRYFCSYGLNARERQPAELNSMEYGTLMHYLLESVLNGDLSRYQEDPARLRADLEQLIRRYADERMGGYESMSGREKYRFSRMCAAAFTILERLMEEISSSEFHPAYFELPLREGGKFPPLKIRTESGAEVKVGGIIDRVDLYESPKGTYVRVVDYKTGIKEFKLLEVLYGLNLQMLIYLAALVQNGFALPAGVLYMPAALARISGARDMPPEKVRKETDSSLAMKGLILDDAGIIEAMERGAEGRFLPAGIDKNGKIDKPGNVINSEGFRQLFDYVRTLAATMADSLLRGEVGAEPLMVNGNSCLWCPYGSVCLSQRDDRQIRSVKMDRKAILEEMEHRGEAGKKPGTERGENRG